MNHRKDLRGVASRNEDARGIIAGRVVNRRVRGLAAFTGDDPPAGEEPRQGVPRHGDLEHAETLLGPGHQRLRLIEVQVVEINDGGVRGLVGVFDKAESVGGRPELRVTGNPVFNHLLQHGLLERRVKAQVHLINEIDSVLVVFLTHGEVHQQDDNLLLAVGEQVKGNSRLAFAEIELNGFPWAGVIVISDLYGGRQVVAEDALEGVV